MSNEFLSDVAWDRLREVLALAMTPASLVTDEDVSAMLHDRAANLLAEIGVLPLSCQEEAPRLVA